MISGERTEQLDIFCRVSGFMSDFLSFVDVEHIRFFHGALQFVFNIAGRGTRADPSTPRIYAPDLIEISPPSKAYRAKFGG